MRGAVTDAICRLFHRGWLETEAEVEECTTVQRWRDGIYHTDYYPALGEYVVVFGYTVNGRRYGGTTGSPCQLHKYDKFKIRYNPKCPEQNNTFESSTNWVIPYTKIYSWILALLLALLFALSLVRKR
jgi:hypothetical protein